MKVLLVVGLLVVGCGKPVEEQSSDILINRNDTSSQYEVPDWLTEDHYPHLDLNKDKILDLTDLVIMSKLTHPPRDISTSSPSVSKGIDPSRYFDASGGYHYTYGVFKGVWEHFTEEYINSKNRSDYNPKTDRLCINFESRSSNKYKERCGNKAFSDCRHVGKIAIRFKIDKNDRVVEVKYKISDTIKGKTEYTVPMFNNTSEIKFHSYQGNNRSWGGLAYPSVAHRSFFPRYRISETPQEHVALVTDQELFSECASKGECRVTKSSFGHSTYQKVNWWYTWDSRCPNRDVVNTKLNAEGFLDDYDALFPLRENRLVKFSRGILPISKSCISPMLINVHTTQRDEALIKEIFGDYPDCPAGFGWYSEVTPEQVRAKYFPEDVE